MSNEIKIKKKRGKKEAAHPRSIGSSRTVKIRKNRSVNRIDREKSDSAVSGSSVSPRNDHRQLTITAGYRWQRVSRKISRRRTHGVVQHRLHLMVREGDREEDRTQIRGSSRTLRKRTSEEKENRTGKVDVYRRHPLHVLLFIGTSRARVPSSSPFDVLPIRRFPLRCHSGVVLPLHPRVDENISFHLLRRKSK